MKIPDMRILISGIVVSVECNIVKVKTSIIF